MIATIANRTAALAMSALLLGPSPLLAQDWLGWQAIIDVETWRTGGRSTLLTREKPMAAVGAGHLFWVIEPHPSVQVLGANEIEYATDEEEVEIELDHLTLHVNVRSWLTADVGKFAQPVGTFAARRFSPTNPLIGVPDGYPVTYPLGVLVSGGSTRFDARAALVTLPPSNTAYVPEPGAALRPVVGIGFTPFIGLHLGASWTAGPYLSEDDEGNLPSGSRWQDFHGEVYAGDLRFAHGYFELFAELAASTYQVPTFANEVTGTTYYVEAKYTWSPRFFTAARFERNRYAFIRNTGTAWQARETDFIDGEVGVGYRVRANLLLKASVRADSWDITPAQQAFLGDGWAVAMQVSYRLGTY